MESYGALCYKHLKLVSAEAFIIRHILHTNVVYTVRSYTTNAKEVGSTYCVDDYMFKKTDIRCYRELFRNSMKRIRFVYTW